MNRDLYIWAKKYHLGQLDGKEYEELLAMLEEHPKSADAFYSALTILRGEELEVPPVDTEAALQRHLAREPSRSVRRIQLISQNWWKIAAMFVPFLILIWFLWPASDNRPDLVSTMTTDSLQQEVWLPDSSKVVLAPFSKLTWQDEFDSREVNLTGEAFFAVRRDTNHPFIVQAGTTSVRVLGTEFSVTDRPDQQTKVEVLQGKVAVSRIKSSKHIILTPLESTVWDDTDQNWIKKELMDEGDLAWATRVWRIDQKSLFDIIPGLEKMYGIRIGVSDDALLQCRISMTLDHKSQEEMLAILKLVLRIEVRYNDDKIILDGPGC
ncbi:MAG: FecR domain-containing protein [Saprospiraceae bacterium]